MMFCKSFRACLLTAFLFMAALPALHASEDASAFHDVLALAGVGPDELAQFGQDAGQISDVWQAKDWSLLTQILYRLRQYPDEQLQQWTRATQPQRWFDEPAAHGGQLVEVSAQVESWEALSVPQEIAQAQGLSTVYRCQFGSDSPAFTGTLISRKIPRRWKSGEIKGEAVRFRGVIVQVSKSPAQGRVLLVTDRLAWYPRQGVPMGQLLLARQGMDVALLDEVVHRQPFVFPSISREGEAFYGCLQALGRMNHEELAARCKENVATAADKWRKAQPDLRKQYKAAQEQLAQTATPKKRKDLQKKEAALRERQSVAAAVIKQSEQGLSSLGPLFVHPESEVGELIQLEGVARRAVRIAVPERPKIGAYFEIEIFTPEAKYLESRPVVCCVNRLPTGFPEGDVLSEPVRVSGIFFKSWLYRTREVVKPGEGETGRQRRLYTPLILADAPTWLQVSESRQSPWALWGGIAFVLALAAMWLTMARSARRERRARQAGAARILLDESSKRIERG